MGNFEEHMYGELEDIVEEYPHSKLKKYGDFYELRFRFGDEPGCLQVRGTKEQVRGQVINLIRRHKSQ